MLPVWRKSPPEVLAQFHMRWARSRAWMFCRVMGVGSAPPSIFFVASSSRSKASSMETTVKRTSSSLAMVSAASLRAVGGEAGRHVERLDQRAGVQRAHPLAQRWAISRVSSESRPPESAMPTRVKAPVFSK